jgi:hypothetical protein
MMGKSASGQFEPITVDTTAFFGQGGRWASRGECTTMGDINALARLLAVEVLLAEPELLGNDALEADLYILRDKLRKAAGRPGRFLP